MLIPTKTEPYTFNFWFNLLALYRYLLAGSYPGDDDLATASYTRLDVNRINSTCAAFLIESQGFVLWFKVVDDAVVRDVVML